VIGVLRVALSCPVRLQKAHPRFLTHNFFCNGFKRSAFPSQMMNTSYGENCINISGSYPEKQVVKLRCTNQFSTIFG